jgi:hypothetical protein
MSLTSLIRDRQVRGRASALRRAVTQLPIDARRAMLAALRDDELIVGAYADRHGHVCPMLAAHRRGARTHVGDFPRAWDEFARARRPRRATARELEILKALLQESVVEPTAGNPPAGWLASAGRASASGETGHRSPRPTTA